MIHC